MTSSFDEATRLSLIADYVLNVGGLSIFVCGLVGNLANILVFVVLPQFNQLPTSIFLITSYSGSFITLLTGLLPQLIYRLTRIDPLVNYVIFCKLRWFIGVGTATVAVHSLCFAAFNQYLLTKNAVRYRQLITRRRAICLSLAIVIYCALSVSPNLIYYTHAINSINRTTCTMIDPIVASYNAYSTLFIYTLVPMFVLSLCSALILRNIRSISSRRTALEEAVRRMLSAQIIIVFIATVAYCVRRIYFLYASSWENDSIRIAQNDIITNVFTLFGFSIHGFTFIIYLAISKTFRKNIQYLFCKRQHRVRVEIPMHIIS